MSLEAKRIIQFSMHRVLCVKDLFTEELHYFHHYSAREKLNEQRNTTN
jgi:hypothetical protein